MIGSRSHGQLDLTQQGAFQAGFTREDGFAFLLFAIIQFHLGVQVTPVTGGRTGLFDVAKVVVPALGQGARKTWELSVFTLKMLARIATGEASIADVGWELFRLILDVASGRKRVAADRLGLHNSLVLFNPAPVT